ncbi:MAG: hypothetical protein ACPLXC_01090 [Candidatus Pacearchaeota archaeon]
MKIKFDRIIVIFLFLIAALLLVSGQQGCKKEQATMFNTTALVSSFVADAPPSQLVTAENYPIYVDVVNHGGFDVSPGNAHFYLSGIGDNLQNVNLHVQNAQLLNKKTPLQEGGKERLTFATQATPPERGLPTAFNFTIKLDYCYKYATVVQSSICVGKGDGICSVSGEKIATGMNSAAPIQVTNLTERVEGNRLYVAFKIENKGTGEVYLPNTDCTKLQEQNIDEKLKQNQVELSINTEEGFACTLQGGVKGLTGTTEVRQVTCEKLLTNAQSHSAPFEIALSYIYRESLTKQLTILPA